MKKKITSRTSSSNTKQDQVIKQLHEDEPNTCMRVSMDPNTKLEGTQEGEAIKKKAKNGKPSGVWMKVKWGWIFCISELEKREKPEEDESNKGINRIDGLFCIWRLISTQICKRGLKFFFFFFAKHG